MTAASIIIIAGCDNARQVEEPKPCPSIYAPPDKPTFDKKFDVELELPITEDEFLRLLDDAGIQYSGPGEPRRIFPMGLYFLCKGVKEFDAARGYLIEDNEEHELGTGVHHIAVVDGAGDVVYIESQWGYRSPAFPEEWNNISSSSDDDKD